MEDMNEGGNDNVEIQEKHFEMAHFPNQMFAMGTNHFAQHQAGLMPSGSRLAAPKKPMSPKRIPRPMNAFMIFSNENRTEMRKRFPLLQNKELSKRLGAVWRKLNKEEQDIYYRKAKLASEDHRRKYPDYHYRPRGRGPNAPEKLNKTVIKGVSATNPPVLAAGQSSSGANLNSLPSPSLAHSFLDAPQLKATAPTADMPSSSMYQHNQAVAARVNNRRQRSRASGQQMTLANMAALPTSVADSLKPAFFGENSQNSMSAVANFYQQYLYGAPTEFAQLASSGKTLAVPAALLSDRARVLPTPGPAHSNSQIASGNSFKQIYSGENTNLPVTSAAWLPQLALNGNVQYGAQPPFPVMFLNQQGKPVAINPYLQSVALRQQNMPGYDAYLRLASTAAAATAGDPNQNSSGNSNGGYHTYLTPPPSHAGSTSSVSSPPFSTESSQPNCNIQRGGNGGESFAAQQFSSNRMFLSSIASQLQDADGRRSCQAADLSTDADDQSTFTSWDNSNVDGLGYESSNTPGFYSDSGMGSQQNQSLDSGFMMSDLAEDHSNSDAINMSAGSAGNFQRESWREMAGQQQQQQFMAGHYLVQQHQYANSPLALDQLRQANAALSAASSNNDRQLSSDLRAFPDEMLNNCNNSNGSHFAKPYPEGNYGEVFSVATTATASVEDLDDEAADFEGDRLLNFNFDDNGVPNTCVSDMLSADGNGIDSYHAFDNGDGSRWDFRDDLNDVEPGAGRDLPQNGASSSTSECALLEATGL